MQAVRILVKCILVVNLFVCINVTELYFILYHRYLTVANPTAMLVEGGTEGREGQET